MHRTIQKHIMMNSNEAEELRKKAKLTCLTEAALIRLLIKGYEPREKPDEEFYSYMREMSLIGNNINQIAAKVNSLGLFDSDRFEGEMERLHKLSADLKAKFLEPVDRRGFWQ
ncbi:MAG: plasmid mobilization relaxosome protein MobC [Firmicutes bacterium]|nr:plasmid mobilization relaxosome protein MobC [Bacillota bacterium]